MSEAICKFVDKDGNRCHKFALTGYTLCLLHLPVLRWWHYRREHKR